MVNLGNKKTGDWLLLLNGLILAIVINQLAGIYFFRIDLTEEKRYTVKQPTRELLRNLQDDVYVEVFLEGDLNPGFKRLRKSIQETLEEFRTFSGNKVHYTFTDPTTAKGANAQREYIAELAGKGIQPTNVVDTREGQRIEKLVFPGALVSYGAAEKGVMLLKGNRALGSEEVLNQSIEGIEYELSNAILNLTTDERKNIGWITGHGELDSLQAASLLNSLREAHNVFKVDLSSMEMEKRHYDVLVIAKPTRTFPEHDRYVLDQFLIRGGRLLLLLDQLDASLDSASLPGYFAFPYPGELGEQIYHYGVRVNQDLVQDLVSMRYPVVTGMLNGKPQINPIDWPFFPMINHYADHPVTNNLDASVLRFTSSIDTVKAPGIRKTPLLFTSVYSRRMLAPVRVSVNDLRKEINPGNFSKGPFMLGCLLEGKFSSVFRNRFLPDGVKVVDFLAEGVESKLIVVADGDLARNEVNTRNGQPQPLGFDSFSGYTFANSELIMNMVSYLADDRGLIRTRNKEVKVRPLDREKIRSEKTSWQAVNLLLPLTVIALAGIGKVYFRKRRYSRFK